MSAIKGSAQYAGSLPVVSPTTLENDPFADGQLSPRKRASRAFFRFLVAFCAGVAATLAWWSYGDAARKMIANWYAPLGWLAPEAEPVAQSAPNMIALPTPATPSFDQRSEVYLDAIRQSIDQIVAGQEQMMRSIDQIASGIAAGQEQMARSIDRIASSIAASQEQMTRSTDQTATSIGQSPSAKVGGVAVDSRLDAPSLQPAARSEAKPSERQLSGASTHDSSCFSSASAVLQNYPGSSPSWTLRAPGHEGTKCWRAANQGKRSNQGSDER